jgi:hypothetical protein
MRPSPRQAALGAGGVIATAAGAHTLIAGARSIPGEAPADASVESELRFYAAFYVAYGVAVLRTAPRADEDVAAVRALAGTLFLGGLARAGGWLAAGKPHPLHRVLLAIELALPPLLVAGQEGPCVRRGRRRSPGCRAPRRRSSSSR